MKYAIIAAGLLFSSPVFASAQTTPMGAQFGTWPGATTGSGEVQCQSPNALPYSQCVWPPDAIKGFAGTFTVKRANIEVRLQLFCAGQVVWMGEAYQGTVSISVMGLPAGLLRPCWFAWQENNNSGTFTPNGDFEYQLTIYSGTP